MLIPRITDAHVHLRQGEMCRIVKPYTERVCAHCIAMPNVSITTEQMREEYHMEQCEVHLTCKLLETTTIREIEEAKKKGVIGYKLYPRGVTTNSGDGISERWLKTLPIAFRTQLDALAANGLVLMHHGEMPGEFVMEAEAEYCWVFKEIVRRFPRLRNTFEHISSAYAIRTVDMLRKEGFSVFGTITLHHLILILDDVVGHVHNYCKPVAKRPTDRACLLRAVGRMGLGSDSAPHWKHAKLQGAAGIFSAPVLVEKLVEIIKDRDVLLRFVSINSNNFYGFKEPSKDKSIELKQEKWCVPLAIEGIVPFMAGCEVEWRT